MNIFTSSSVLPKYPLGYFYPALPVVRLACAVDFGLNSHSSWPSSIYFRIMNIAENNRSVATTSYCSCELAIESGDIFNTSNPMEKAKNLWKNLGYGLVCTGSFKELQFLREECLINPVIYIDEEHLELRIKELVQDFPIENDIVFPEITENTCPKKNCNNSYHRSWRLLTFIEQYKLHFYKHASFKDIELSFEAFGHLDLAI